MVIKWQRHLIVDKCAIIHLWKATLVTPIILSSNISLPHTALQYKFRSFCLSFKASNFLVIW